MPRLQCARDLLRLRQWEANGGDYDYYNNWPLMDKYTSTTGGPTAQCGNPSTSSGTEPVDRDFDVVLTGDESATTLRGDTTDTPFSSDGTMHWDLSRTPSTP